MEKNYSNNDYARLGERIRDNSTSILEDDLKMLQTLRMSYKDDLSYVFNILLAYAKKADKKSITTYRVKRIESIISKLHRIPKLKLNRMSDIAGCRCIMHTNAQVYNLFNALNDAKLDIKHVNDYIKEPKSTGYKSLHLIVAVSKESSKTIEVQLRCVDDHNWATLVEITDLVYHTRIKETGEDGDLAVFHKLLSSNFEDIEYDSKCKLVRIANSHNYFIRLSEIFNNNYLDVRDKWNSYKSSSSKFYLIATGDDGSPEISACKTFEEAEFAYFDKYSENSANKNIVLTYIANASFEDISLAYSNYFLTYNALFYKCYTLISELVLESYLNNKIIYFCKIYDFFLRMTTHMLGVHLADLVAFQHKKIGVRSVKKKNEWAQSIKQHINLIARTFNFTNKRILSTKKHWICLTICKYKLFRLSLKPIHPYKDSKNRIKRI